MKSAELNNYIQHYLEEDKTKSAIMLTGAWGIGKSHYILNELVPFLNKDNKNRCIVVSLYGLNSVAEISKSIYLEARVKILKNAGEKATTGMLAAKTVAKGITSFFGVDLKTSDDEMQKIYESIDLAGKLVVLEDIERSKIDLFELLGYVNSLVEQDGVKALLVANEDEIIKYESIIEETAEEQEAAELLDRISNHKNRSYTEDTLRYFAVKEKTIGDTIKFEADFTAAISKIIETYNNATLSKYGDEKSAKEICDIMSECKNYNLRSFIFACQKSTDIFEYLQGTYDDDFMQCIFFGIIYFSLRMKAGEDMKWDDGEHYSIKLGNERFPLFKFCYDYITCQKFDVSLVLSAAEALKKMRLYDKRKTSDDPDIRTLSNYYISTEEEVKNAVESITKRLENPEDISFYDYGSIAVYIIIIKHYLGCNVEKCKQLLIKNLYGQGDELNIEELFHTVIRDEKPEIQEEYDLLCREMGNALKSIGIIPDFDYKPEQARYLYNYVIKNYEQFIFKEGFAKYFDIARLIKMFEGSSAEEMHSIRGVFLAVYRDNGMRRCYLGDATAVEQLQKGIKNLKSKSSFDKIQKLQCEWFVENLTNILRDLK